MARLCFQSQEPTAKNLILDMINYLLIIEIKVKHCSQDERLLNEEQH